MSAPDPLPLESFERPSLAVDVAVVTVHQAELHVLLIRRTAPPFEGEVGLPGGFVRIDESLDDAARRVLHDKAGLEGVFLEQLYTFGALDRDPRSRVVSVAYYALVDHPRLQVAIDSGLGVEDPTLATILVSWEGERGGAVQVAADAAPLPLAFDHADILGMVVKRLRGKLDYAALGFQLLAERFTLRELQNVHEGILGRPVNKDSFRRRILASGLVEATGEHERNVVHRPAELYAFARTTEGDPT